MYFHTLLVIVKKKKNGEKLKFNILILLIIAVKELKKNKTF